MLSGEGDEPVIVPQGACSSTDVVSAMLDGVYRVTRRND